MSLRGNFLFFRQDDSGNLARAVLGLGVAALAVGGLYLSGAVQHNFDVLGYNGVIKYLTIALGGASLGLFFHSFALFNIFNERNPNQQHIWVSMIVLWPLAWAAASGAMVSYEGQSLRQDRQASLHQVEAIFNTISRTDVMRYHGLFN